MPTPAPGHRVRFAIVGVFVVAVVLQFYLAGRGVFGASSGYSAHKDVAGVLHALSALIFIATVAVKATRTRPDVVLSALLFVLMTVQFSLATFKHPGIGALHPLNGLLILGIAGVIFHRDMAPHNATAT